MDAATIKRMGKTAIINGSSYDVVPAEQLEEMGPLSGTGTSLVVFSELYQPRRNDSVDYDGKNLTVASPTDERLQLFYVNAKTAETRVQVDFELCSPFDIQSLQLPTRQITPVCTWCMRGWYRSGTGCDYNGTKYFTKDGMPTDDPSKDVCGGRRQDCLDRHGPDTPLPFGGFPAANLQGK